MLRVVKSLTRFSDMLQAGSGLGLTRMVPGAFSAAITHRFDGCGCRTALIIFCVSEYSIMLFDIRPWVFF